MVDVPDADLNPFCERASVRMEKPVSLVVLDHVERMKVSLAVGTVDLERLLSTLYPPLRIAKQTDISDNLTDLCKLDCSLDWEPASDQIWRLQQGCHSATADNLTY